MTRTISDDDDGGCTDNYDDNGDKNYQRTYNYCEYFEFKNCQINQKPTNLGMERLSLVPRLT